MGRSEDPRIQVRSARSRSFDGSCASVWPDSIEATTARLMGTGRFPESLARPAEVYHSSPSRSRTLPLESGCGQTGRVRGPALPRVRPVRASPARAQSHQPAGEAVRRTDRAESNRDACGRDRPENTRGLVRLGRASYPDCLIVRMIWRCPFPHAPFRMAMFPFRTSNRRQAGCGDPDGYTDREASKRRYGFMARWCFAIGAGETGSASEGARSVFRKSMSAARSSPGSFRYAAVTDSASP
jgi:hypothetical protein